MIVIMLIIIITILINHLKDIFLHLTNKGCYYFHKNVNWTKSSDAHAQNSAAWFAGRCPKFLARILHSGVIRIAFLPSLWLIRRQIRHFTLIFYAKNPEAVQISIYISTASPQTNVRFQDLLQWLWRQLSHGMEHHAAW